MMKKELVLMLMREILQDKDVASAMDSPKEFIFEYWEHSPSQFSFYKESEALLGALQHALGVASRIGLVSSMDTSEILGKMECEYGTVLPAILVLKWQDQATFTRAAAHLREKKLAQRQEVRDGTTQDL